MSPKPLRERIVTALQLQPMTVEDLALALWAHPCPIRIALANLRASASIKLAGTIRRSRGGAPRKLWRLA